MIVTPNFFQLRPSYAIGRSNFLIDVKFEGEFERGHFEFFSFRKKKELYLKGKKSQDYGIVSADFRGVFKEGYVVNKAEYLRIKRADLVEVEKAEVNPDEIKRSIFTKMYKSLVKTKKITFALLSDAFNIDKRTGYRWIKATEDTNELLIENGDDRGQNIIYSNLNKSEILPNA